MAKDKEKQMNPATAALKAAKKSSIKKQKTQLAAQRAEKLARRNPERLQRQIDALREQRDSSSGVLRPHERRQLEELERDVTRIRKARDLLGVEDKPLRERQYNNNDDDDDGEGKDGDSRGVLGKRGRDGQRKRREERAQSSDTDEDARDIPMPLDVENMPPIPRKPRPHNVLPEKPVAPAQTVYSSAPQVRDLRKEAVSRFVPAAVASKLAAVKGEGTLLEPEEADRLERAGYTAAKNAADEAEKEVEYRLMEREVLEGPAGSLEEEERRFEEEIMNVERDEIDVTVERAADEAEKETEYRLMAKEIEQGPAMSAQEQANRVEQEARHVEIEEVSDEDL